jgi:hypothetical protein
MRPNGNGSAAVADQPGESHLNDGETVTATLGTAGGRLYATDQRVLVVPDGDRPVRSCPRSDAADVRVDTVSRSGLRRPLVRLRGLGRKLTPVGGRGDSSVSNPVGSTGVAGSGNRLWRQTGALAMAGVAVAVIAGVNPLMAALPLAVAGFAALWGWPRRPAVRIDVLEGENLVLPGEVTDRRELYAFREAVFAE